MSRSSPILRAAPSAAATWPCGSERTMLIASPIARNDRAALQERFEAGDALGRPVGKVEQRALPHLAALAIALAQQDRRRRVAVRDRLDVHGAMIGQSTIQHKLKPLSYMATHWLGQGSLPPKYQSLNVDERRKLRLASEVPFYRVPNRVTL